MNGLWTPQSATSGDPPRPWPLPRNVLLKRLTIFSSEYYQILIATHLPTPRDGRLSWPEHHECKWLDRGYYSKALLVGIEPATSESLVRETETLLLRHRRVTEDLVEKISSKNTKLRHGGVTVWRVALLMCWEVTVWWWCMTVAVAFCDQQRVLTDNDTRWRSASSGSPLPEWTDFGLRSLQLQVTHLCPDLYPAKYASEQWYYHCSFVFHHVF